MIDLFEMGSTITVASVPRFWNDRNTVRVVFSASSWDSPYIEHLVDVADVLAAENALAESEREGFVDWEELKRELGL
jgi:hypothetical protein